MISYLQDFFLCTFYVYYGKVLQRIWLIIRIVKGLGCGGG